MFEISALCEKADTQMLSPFIYSSVSNFLLQISTGHFLSSTSLNDVSIDIGKFIIFIISLSATSTVLLSTQFAELTVVLSFTYLGVFMLYLCFVTV